jgi:hypothetical protein
MRWPSGSSIATGASRGAGWLRADLSEAVRVAPRGDGAGAAALPPAELEAGLDRWSGRLSRSRALVVTRRWLLVGLIVALVPGLVILAVGGSRPWWLFGVVLVGPLAGLVAIVRPPSAARTAQVLDRRLGLADRLTTALELRSAPVAPTGLGGLVVNEASSALGQSLGSSRASARRSPRELAWLLAAAVALALVIAVPRSSTGASSTRASTGPAAAAGGGAAAASPTHGRTGPGGRTTTPSSAPLPPPRIPKQTFGDGRSHYAPGTDPYGGQFRGGQLQTKQQAGVPTASSSGLGLAAPGGAAAPQGTASGGSGRHGPTPSGGAGQSGTRTPPSGATGKPASGSAGLSGAGGAGGAAGQHASGTPSGAQHAGAGAAAGAHGTASGTQTGSGGQSGGETAGGVRAGQSHGVGLVPALGGSGSGLPLQAGLSGSRAGRSGSHGAVSRTANGGGGFARSAQANSGASGVGGAGVNLPVLAPTFNSPSQPEPGLLQRYFGVANRLAFKGW